MLGLIYIIIKSILINEKGTVVLHALKPVLLSPLKKWLVPLVATLSIMDWLSKSYPK